MSSPPLYRSVRNFRRFELIIAHCVAAWPNASTFKPTEFTAETFAARLRSAIKYFLVSDWISETVDRDSLAHIWSKAGIGHDGTTVTFAEKTHGRLAQAAVEIDKRDLLVIREPDDACVKALLVLANAGHFNDRPVRIISPPDFYLTYFRDSLYAADFGNIFVNEVEPSHFIVL